MTMARKVAKTTSRTSVRVTNGKPVLVTRKPKGVVGKLVDKALKGVGK